MAEPAGQRLVSLFQKNAWWTVPQIALAIGLGYVWGLWAVWLVHAAINIFGVWDYSEYQRFRSPGRQRWLKLLAIPLLPVGILCLLTRGSGSSPRDSVEGTFSGPEAGYGSP